MNKRIILDTDLGSDCDDAGALAVLHALADAGEAEVLACVYSSGVNSYGPGCVAAINAWYGRPEIPVGAAAESEVGDPRNDFLEPIATNRAAYGHRMVTRLDAEDLVTVYRRALAAAPDRTVRIVSIGHTKGLYDLLHSPGDAVSALDGTELVREKVDTWIAMGGCFPQEKEPGWNFGQMGAARYSQTVVKRWPTPIIFTGYEIGLPIMTGRSLLDTPEGNPVREAYRLWNNALEQNRPSWDQTAVLCAVRGAKPYWEMERGCCDVDATGRTEWTPAPDGPHARLTEKMPARELANIIGELMARAPRYRQISK
jgi:hypothetical protein